jgi:SepF-like predicted cell division protein (DUF552 family)
MGIGDFFRRGSAVEESIELPVDEMQEPSEKIMVRVETLTGMIDVERVEKMVREGNIMLLKVKDLQTNDLGEFKNTVQKLKRRSLQYGWDLVAISDGYILVVPKFAKIVR